MRRGRNGRQSARKESVYAVVRRIDFENKERWIAKGISGTVNEIGMFVTGIAIGCLLHLYLAEVVIHTVAVAGVVVHHVNGRLPGNVNLPVDLVHLLQRADYRQDHLHLERVEDVLTRVLLIVPFRHRDSVSHKRDTLAVRVLHAVVVLKALVAAVARFVVVVSVGLLHHPVVMDVLFHQRSHPIRGLVHVLAPLHLLLHVLANVRQVRVYLVHVPGRALHLVGRTHLTKSVLELEADPQIPLCPLVLMILSLP